MAAGILVRKKITLRNPGMSEANMQDTTKHYSFEFENDEKPPPMIER
jgi:hypothetical protein